MSAAPCMSRHLDNAGKPRPPVEWSITYGCSEGHVFTTDVCDRCASSLTDGSQRCAKCFRRMVVSRLDVVTTSATSRPTGEPSQDDRPGTRS